MPSAPCAASDKTVGHEESRRSLVAMTMRHAHTPHESPLVVTVPLIALAIPSASSAS